MNPKAKELTYQQAKELKWFCENVTGLKAEFYPVLDKVLALDDRIKRLEKTCELVEKFIRGANAESEG